MNELDRFRETFVKARIHAQYLAVADVTALVIPAFQISFTVADGTFGHPAIYPWMIFARMTCIGMALAYPFVRRRNELAARAYIQCAVLYYLFWSMGLYAHSLELGLHARSVVPAMNLLASSVLIVCTAAFSSRVNRWIVVLISAVLVFFLRHELLSQLRFIIVHVLATFGVSALKTMDGGELRDIAVRELSLRLRTAPLDLVRRSLEQSSKPLEDLLKPQQRSVVCLTSDWRGYQGIARDFKPEAIAAALGAYYDHCRRLLATHFPMGGYYCDWIADELIVTVLVDEGQEAATARSALRFAHALVEEKNPFHAKYGMPRGIDIGIAAGRATVGLSGPRDNPKMMAIGAVPHLARSLQSEAKALRRTDGDRDRVLFDREFATLVGEPHGKLSA